MPRQGTMKNLALEWKQYGIRSCSIVPGPIEGTGGMKRPADPQDLKQRVNRAPMQHIGKTEGIGYAVLLGRLWRATSRM